ncbi:Uncharacterised protein [Halioglobus japonicus]|nr:Uncharacterised protein [Halioglobus japonicus]
MKLVTVYMSLWASVLFLALGATPGNAIPLSDTVIANGKTWAQPDLFGNLTWTEVNTICPLGPCEPSLLNGHDMTGWQWANLTELIDLFKSYLGSDQEVTFGYVIDFTGDSAERFWSDGWRSMNGECNSLNYINCYISGSAAFGAPPFTVWVPQLKSACNLPECSQAQWWINIGTGTAGSIRAGGWFYKNDDVVSVVTPTPLVLILPFLLLLVSRKQKQSK